MKLKIKNLKVKKDHRGLVVELVKAEDIGPKIFGQILLSRAKRNKTKGGHYHKRKTEWYVIINGNGLLELKDIETGEVKTLKLSGKNMKLIEIPPKIWHLIKNTGNIDMDLIAYTNEAFDPEDPDTFTINP